MRSRILSKGSGGYFSNSDGAFAVDRRQFTHKYISRKQGSASISSKNWFFSKIGCMVDLPGLKSH